MRDATAGFLRRKHDDHLTANSLYSLQVFGYSMSYEQNCSENIFEAVASSLNLAMHIRFCTAKYLISSIFLLHMYTKSGLAIKLSQLKVFLAPNPKLEQYPTDSEVAATVLWDAFMQNDIENKSIVDLGCGTGILGIGALLLGAKKVYFVDIDEAALSVLEENLSGLDIDKIRYEIIHIDINEFTMSNPGNAKADVVIQNPPFGTKKEHADKLFLEKAFKIAPVIYSLHKTTSKRFIDAIAKDNSFEAKVINEFAFPIKSTMKFHKKRIERIEVVCWRMEKI